MTKQETLEFMKKINYIDFVESGMTCFCSYSKDFYELWKDSSFRKNLAIIANEFLKQRSPDYMRVEVNENIEDYDYLFQIKMFLDINQRFESNRVIRKQFLLYIKSL